MSDEEIDLYENWVHPDAYLVGATVAFGGGMIIGSWAALFRSGVYVFGLPMETVAVGGAGLVVIILALLYFKISPAGHAFSETQA